MDGLNERERAFVRAFVDNGGNATQAARAAGYGGGAAGLRAYGSRLRRKADVAAAIARELELAKSARPAAPRASLVKGRGRGTATERVELAMAIARNKKVEPKIRIQALLAAAELEGERGRNRIEPSRPVLLPPPVDEESPTPSARPSLKLVMSDEDAGNG